MAEALSSSLQTLSLNENDSPREIIDLTTLKIKSPYANIIHVASSSGPLSPPVDGKFTVSSIHHALCFVILNAKLTGAVTYSIVVHEGTYVDDVNLLPLSDLPKGFSLEIIGLNDVRLILEKSFLMVYGEINVTLKNLLIFDRRSSNDTQNKAILVRNGARLDLVGVEITAPEGQAIVASDPGTRATLSRCKLSDCRSAFSLELKAELLVSDCLITTSEMGVTCFPSTSFSATTTMFVKCGRITILSAKAVVDHCYLLGDRTPDASSMLFTAFSTSDDKGGTSSLSVEGTSIKNYHMGFALRGSSSKITVRNCSITDTDVAFRIEEDSSASIVKNKFNCESVLKLRDNDKGNVEFKGNRMTRDAFPIAIIQMAGNPRHFVHDFKKVKIFPLDKEAPTTASRREQSNFSKEFAAKLKAGELTWEEKREYFMDDKLKCCETCRIFEALPWEASTNEVVEEGDKFKKFKYCSNCKKVCYCSRKCQKNDWRFHKKWCSKFVDK